MFKFLGHSQFLEICTTSKEVVLFHDNDFVLLRFSCRFNFSSNAALTAMLWLTEMVNVYPGWLTILLDLSSIFIFSSVLALLVMKQDINVLIDIWQHIIHSFIKHP